MVNGGRRFFSILLVVISIVVIGLVGYLAYDYISNYLIAKDAAKTVDEFENQIIVVAVDDENTVDEVTNTTVETPSNNNNNNTNKTSTVKYKGYNVIGTIQIPKTKVKYPIVDDISTDAMDRAIVMLYGPGLNQIGNTVIAGHNYRNGGFFGNNKKLELGDKIYITDAYGNKVEYTITNKYLTTDTDFEYASRDTQGKREISLSTCTSDASKRLVIWAKES
mgnify:CR=1 FL=1